MSLGISVSAINVSDGSRIELPPSGIVLFVGPNNAGKSVALREIASQLANPPHPHTPPKVVKQIEIAKEGGPPDLEQWLDAHAVRREPTIAEPYVVYRRHGARAPIQTLQSEWQSAGPQLGNLAQFLSLFLGGDSRLGMVGSAPIWDMMNDDPQNALQLLFINPELEAAVAAAARDAFGTTVFVNRCGGSQIHLQPGEIEPPPSVPPPASYLERLKRLPHLQEQGDGIRAFMGIMLSVIAARYPIVLIDEPEAFLHPPQARLLGRKLATLVPQGTQVFAATHSTSVLLGSLEGPAKNVTVIRLTRNDDINPAAVLTHESIDVLWRDPLLRYSNVLDGLFHRGVVLCEGDADATFYSTTLDWSRGERGQPASDLLFTQCGGKDRMHIAIKALRAVDVPVKAIADFDVVRDAPTLRRLVEAFGGEWGRIEELQKPLAADIGSWAKNPTAKYVKDALRAIVGPLDDARPVPVEKSKEIQGLVRVETGWDQVKRGGLSTLSGDVHERARELLLRLGNIGLFVVPVGELERFCPAAAGLHGPAWVAEALKREAHKSEAARVLLEAVDQAFPR